MFNKFRRWLIHKLGGFTTQIIYEPNVIHAPNHVTLAYRQVLDREYQRLQITEDYEPMMLRRCEEEITVQLIDNHLFHEMRQEDMYGNTVIELRLSVIPPITESVLKPEPNLFEAIKYRD
jgi:hypothetical protein